MRLIIVDDDPIVCQSLKMIIEAAGRQESEGYQVLACAHSGDKAVVLYREFQPDILLLDIQMPGMDGLTAAERIIEEDPSAKILFLTTFLDEKYIIKALHLGAKGYLMKSSVQSLLPALKAIMAGQRVFGDEIVAQIPLKESPSTPADKDRLRELSIFKELSEGEWEMLKLLANGYNNQEVAAALHFSPGTVRNYISSILEKTALRDRTQLVVAYYKAGFK